MHRGVATLTAAASMLIISGCSDTAPRQPRTTVTAPFDAVADFSDLRRLAGISDAIFVGRVITQSGSKALNSTPETQFQVKVVDTLKGQLDSTVTVNQQGGIDEKSNSVVLIGGDALLTTGDHYLFATRYLPSENWYTLIPGFGDRPITQNEAAAAAGQGQQPKSVSDMRAAITDEIAFSPGG